MNVKGIVKFEISQRLRKGERVWQKQNFQIRKADGSMVTANSKPKVLQTKSLLEALEIITAKECVSGVSEMILMWG